jgi:thiopurine S-methyltransferase
VFVPLCGKSEDLVWLARQHDSVQGVELSDIAVRAFFSEHFYTPLVTQINAGHTLYQFDELTIYSGDYFTAPLESYDLVYDRAALVALPEDMREEYVDRLKCLMSEKGRILLVTLDYVQAEMAGPPFSVAESEVRRLFSEYKVTLLQRDEADEKHPKRSKKGLSRFAEEVWLIEADG